MRLRIRCFQCCNRAYDLSFSGNKIHPALLPMQDSAVLDRQPPWWVAAGPSGERNCRRPHEVKCSRTRNANSSTTDIQHPTKNTPSRMEVLVRPTGRMLKSGCHASFLPIHRKHKTDRTARVSTSSSSDSWRPLPPLSVLFQNILRVAPPCSCGKRD